LVSLPRRDRFAAMLVVERPKKAAQHQGKNKLKNAKG